MYYGASLARLRSIPNIQSFHAFSWELVSAPIWVGNTGPIAAHGEPTKVGTVCRVANFVIVPWTIQPVRIPLLPLTTASEITSLAAHT